MDNAGAPFSSGLPATSASAPGRPIVTLVDGGITRYGTGASELSSRVPPPPVSGITPPDLIPETIVKLKSEAEFDSMVTDARKTFTSWFAQAQDALNEGYAQLQRERVAFEEEKARVWKEFVAQKQAEYDLIRDERRRAEQEVATSKRQIRTEREDAKLRLQGDRDKTDSDLAQGRRQFALQRERFRLEWEAADKERQLVQDINVATEAMVDVNVGGIIFECSRHTLTLQQGSLLERLMTGRAQAPRDKDGRIFLDRDSSLFRTILNFLRSPDVPPPSKDAVESDAVCQEAEYYGIRFFPFPLVYAVGGHDGADHLHAVEVLDVENQCWRPCRGMKTQRSYFGAESFHSRLHLFGGQNLDYKALCETECFDCLRGAWMVGADLLTPRRNCASAVLDGRIFALGGFDGSQILSSVEAYDPRMKNWLPVEPMNTPRSSAAAASLDGKIWVLGGTSGSRLRSTERYEPRMNRWEALRADMIEVRSAAQACNCLDRLYVLGGTDQNQSIHSSAEGHTPEAGTSWSFIKSMQEPRMDFGCCVLSDTIMVGGGQHGEVLQSTEFFRPELDDWQLGPPMLSPRYGHHLLLVNL